MKKSDLLQIIKFTLFSISAGIIQVVSFTFFNELLKWQYWPAYLLSLVLSKTRIISLAPAWEASP